MAKVIIFGVKDFSELAHYYLEHDSVHEVVAFSVDRKYIPESLIFRGLPVIAFEDILSFYSPADYMFFAPMSPKNMNLDREMVYQAIKRKGYSFISYVSSKATVFDNEIGENCFILENNTIQPFAKIGDDVVLWSGNHIGHHSVIHDHVTFTSQVVMSGHCDIGPYSFFGVNSTLRDGLKIAKGTFVAMAATVNRDTEPWGVYKGNPAIKARLVSTDIKF